MTNSPRFDFATTLALALQDHGAGHLPEAEARYRQILQVIPTNADALYGMAVIMWQSGQYSAALNWIERALAQSPGALRYRLSYAEIAAAAGRYSEAISAFQYVCAARPNLVEAWQGLARALHAQDRDAEAVLAYREVIKLAPQSVEAYNDLGVALEASSLLLDAVAAYKAGIELKADFLPLYNNLGNALLKIGQRHEAVIVFQRGLRINEHIAELWYNYANALFSVNASQNAVAAYRRALELEPQHSMAWVNLGNVLRARGELDGSIQCYEQAIALKPDFHDAFNNLGVALKSAGRLDDAIAALQQAVRLQADSSSAQNNLGNAYKDAGRMQDAIQAFQRAVALNPSDPQPHSNLVYSLSFHPDYDDQAILKEAKAWEAAHVQSLPRTRLARDPDPARRLRIGYVSPDFREHCQSLFTIPVFEHHDHGQFEIYCYAQLAISDAISRRIENRADVWRPTYGLSDAEVARLVNEDRIDILVDLTMHMAGGRPLLFARKPAPVQIAWLAYPGTTGLSAIDYRLTDPWLNPDGAGDECYAERSLRLPHTFWCYDPQTNEPAVNALPAQSNGYVTFGCLNNFCKVSDQSLRLWGQVMRAVPNSRLILQSPLGQHRERVYAILSEFSIDQQRIEFVPFMPREQYLATYHRIDICLDTLPYNGHTTSLDAFWMGVPVVTLVGQTVAGRAGWSQLNNLGYRELAGFSQEQFVALAVKLAQDIPRLRTLRETLRGQMRQCALMDAAGFTRALEGAFREVWMRWCASLG